MALPDRPLSRREEYLAAIAGEEGVKPDRPLSRTEEYLEAIDEYLDTKANLVDGKVPASELPSYVDDVVEGYYHDSKFYEDAQYTEEITPESSKIYVDLATGYTYRWGGTVYVQIGGGGGGGSADFEKLELTIDANNNQIVTTKTVREIIALYSQGKCFASSLALDPDPQSLICVQVYYGTLIYLGDDGYLLAGFTHSPESIVRLEFTAPDNLDAVFTASLPN